MFDDFTGSYAVQSFIVFCFLLKSFFLDAVLSLYQFFHFLLLPVIFNFHCFWSALYFPPFHLQAVLVCLLLLMFPLLSLPFFSFPVLPVCLTFYYHYFWKHGWVALKYCKNNLLLRYLGGGDDKTTANIYSNEHVSLSGWGQMVDSNH